MNDDLTAVRRLKNGEIAGLETLVCRYQVKAMRAAFLILHDEQAAEDVVQQTFLRIFEHIGSFDEQRPFGPYLLRSVVNAALDVAKHDAKQEQVGDGFDAVEDLFENATTVEAQAEFNALKQDIYQALQRLSPRQRAVVVMRYYLEMTEKEMSTSLHVRPGTVKWLLNAARQRLRGLLAAERSVK